MLARSDPGRSAQLLDLAQADIDERWHYYEQLAGLERMVPRHHDPDEPADVTAANEVTVERTAGAPVEVARHD